MSYESEFYYLNRFCEKCVNVILIKCSDDIIFVFGCKLSDRRANFKRETPKGCIYYLELLVEDDK